LHLVGCFRNYITMHRFVNIKPGKYFSNAHVFICVWCYILCLVLYSVFGAIFCVWCYILCLVLYSRGLTSRTLCVGSVQFASDLYNLRRICTICVGSVQFASDLYNLRRICTISVGSVQFASDLYNLRRICTISSQCRTICWNFCQGVLCLCRHSVMGQATECGSCLSHYCWIA